MTRGLYSVSRHPQQVMVYTAFLGVVLAAGARLMLAAHLLMLPLVHRKVVAEEQACLERYGTGYRRYIEARPRHLLLF